MADISGILTNLSELLVLTENIETNIEDPTFAGPERGEDFASLLNQSAMLLDYATRIHKQIGSLSLNDLRQRVEDAEG